MQAFIICGYGTPKDIFADEHYRMYLNLAFNTIYDAAASQPALIIVCGGPTNCDPPYNGTEAQAMAAYLRKLMQRKETGEATALWEICEEDQSLSTLENLVFAKHMLDQRAFNQDVRIFCEYTRQARLRAFAEVIFPACTVTVCPIDFDQSKNRYLDPEVLAKKEELATSEGLHTLEDPARLAEHHALFEKKMAFLRQRQNEGLSHVDAVREWFLKHTDADFGK